MSYQSASVLEIDFRIPYTVRQDHIYANNSYIFEDARGHQCKISHKNMIDIQIYHDKWRYDHTRTSIVSIFLNHDRYADSHIPVSLPLTEEACFKKSKLNLKLLLI